MRVRPFFFDGDFYALGVKLGYMLDDLFHSEIFQIRRHEGGIPEFLVPFFEGLHETLGIPIADLIAVALTKRVDEQRKSLIRNFGGSYLGARYDLKEEDLVLIAYGPIDGKERLLGWTFPHLPGSLFGVNRDGLAWCAPAHPALLSTQQYVMLTETRATQLMKILLALGPAERVTVALPYKSDLVKKQPNFIGELKTTPEAATRILAEGSSSANNTLVVGVDCRTQEVLTIRPSTHNEVIFNIHHTI